ncbi:MAG: hypothetical protein ABUJ92_14685, partial [Desulfobacterales bacterium]
RDMRCVSYDRMTVNAHKGPARSSKVAVMGKFADRTGRQPVVASVRNRIPVVTLAAVKLGTNSRAVPLYSRIAPGHRRRRAVTQTRRTRVVVG